ncbi:MAG: hypothetical protein ABEI52_03775, partial [Halobacteriaceae archaeon]
MTSLDVYTTDANPRNVYTTRAESPRPDDWVDQLARISTESVDLFVDVPNARVIWTFRAARPGTTRRMNRYLADFRDESAASAEALFRGFQGAMESLYGEEGWSFPDDPELRWRVGFDIVDIPGECHGISASEEDALLNAGAEGWDQVYL